MHCCYFVIVYLSASLRVPTCSFHIAVMIHLGYNCIAYMKKAMTECLGFPLEVCDEKNSSSQSYEEHWVLLLLK